MMVVNVRVARCTHYIGRGHGPTGIFTGLGNPFHMADYSDKERRRVIDGFEYWVRSKPDLMKRIKALPENAVLGCWCKPKDCHGDVIVKLWKELNQS